MPSKLAQLAAGPALAALAMIAAPSASANNIVTPTVPSDPYYSPPGYIGSLPGNYTFQGTFEWVRPRRSVDSAGIAAMTNADPAGSGAGLPGSHLGVEPQRYGPSGAVSGMRPSAPQQSASTSPAAGGILPGTSVSNGLEDPSGKAPKKPITPEAAQPGSTSTTALPNTANSGPDSPPSASDDDASSGN
ncbi:MAG: hypothetical protein ACRC20_01675 [Segniliparus sp.]|uniref:hypothetical protein n=1 Tax=Segniliparus sp. TaxID=2804064 RepID=UPI003F3EC79F